ncbi:PREDICTED: uncharacterized protein LOC106811457 [Priapulus caudatus]|uniref:Uncharacterized protein LOC106811457 n=1 Tax=Priapulus caudatus TaxID=37621 RepID=A0ABM1EEE5_PRICU|nr:PREDICTED: uncharacterized protein LOC106811457 [Priapulus caudatus]
MSQQGSISLKRNHFNPLGTGDGASAYDNIKDTAEGKQAKLSSYCCSVGCAPGGHICLTSSMLKSLYTYATQFWSTNSKPLQVSSLAGSCHSTTSHHYEGNTWDVACTSPLNHCSALIRHCMSENPVEICYPGGPCRGHATWVHCVHP